MIRYPKVIWTVTDVSGRRALHGEDDVFPSTQYDVSIVREDFDRILSAENTSVIFNAVLWIFVFVHDVLLRRFVHPYTATIYDLTLVEAEALAFDTGLRSNDYTKFPEPDQIVFDMCGRQFTTRASITDMQAAISDKLDEHRD